jgi:hypothetical protein
MNVVFQLIVAYTDLVTDIILAITLLAGETHKAYGYASIGFLGFSLVVQVFVVTFLGREPCLSKAVLLSAFYLGPALEAYRVTFEPERRGFMNVQIILAILKAIEVLFESVPALVLQLKLLIDDAADGWSSPALVGSLVSSVVAAAVLIVDAERNMNSQVINRRIFHEYLGYLPMHGCRRKEVLLYATIFAGGYLVLATSTVAVASRLFPTVALAVLAADYASFHLARVAVGEWWVTGDDVRTGVGVWLRDLFVNTTLWLLCHVCPVWSMRDPNWVGPHLVAWTIACSLLESAAVISAALFIPTSSADANAALSSNSTGELAANGADSALTMVRFISLPALCVALVSLALFFLVMEPRYRRTFYARDPRRDFVRRHWAEAEGRPTAEADRASIAARAKRFRYVGDLVCAWIVQGAQDWEREQPEWYTEAWRAIVRANLHLLGEGGSAALAAISGGGGVEDAAALQTV